MGNTISFNSKVSSDDDSLVMSNGLTDVLIDVLILSGSRLAKSESERRFIAFLAEKQQNIVGIGTVGFEIARMPWDVPSFLSDKRFLLDTVRAAREKTGWEILQYEPNPENISYALDGFESLVNRMTLGDISDENLEEWLSGRKADDPVLAGCTKCPVHGAVMSFLGCKFCNDLGGEYKFKDKK